jgi:hypothetical protein
MKTNRAILSIIVFLFSSASLYANLAEVTRIIGSASYMSPGMKEAKEIIKGIWLPKDSSILTKDKSLVILKYRDGSNITLGPNSKIVIDQALEKDQKVLSLLTGKIKAAINNEKNTDDNKVIIKTKMAAMGIRGTEFQTSFNPDTKITSLLTFHGRVAMVKMDESKAPAPLNLNKIENKLKTDSVEVGLGQYAGVSDNLNTASAPIKIAPEQFVKLKLNETMGATEEKIDNEKLKKELEKTIVDYSNVSKNETPNNDNHPVQRAGGIVDIETGIYLPPTKDSAFDEKLKIYKVGSEMGKIDDHGNYLPPEGLKIDAQKGLIVDQKIASNETIELAKKLKDDINIQIPKTNLSPVKKKSNLKVNEDDVYDKYYKLPE